MESRYGHSIEVWGNAKEEMRQILIEYAKIGETIPYSLLVSLVNTVSLEPHSLALATMLGEISTEEDNSGRGMLSVIVVHKHGDMQPGPGFFELAASLGRNTSDILKCWVDELNRVYDYWGAT